MLDDGFDQVRKVLKEVTLTMTPEQFHVLHGILEEFTTDAPDEGDFVYRKNVVRSLRFTFEKK